MFWFLIFITLFSFGAQSFSQKVVVSEYYNVTGDPQGEWTELLVVEDNVDLVGYTLRDNSGSTPPPSQWTGGIRFKNHPLWRNLRAGTIIVINHRYSPYQAVDVNKNDGYIEIDAENETYFDKRCFSCIVGPEWYQKALNIAQESEIVQIIDQNDNHVHALAHMPSAGGDWLSIPSPKVCYVGSIPRGGVTVRVAPGANLSAYNKGFDTRGEETEQSADFITKGLPNKRLGALLANSSYWRSLREPIWNSPSLVAKVFKDSVLLSWNAMTDPFPQDSISGYLIVRVEFDQLQSAVPPVDGRRYNIGDNLGSGVIVGIITGSQTTRFVDKVFLQCGKRYVYRVYAFRFNYDDFNEDSDENNARGRSYNQRTFAEVVVEKPNLQKPELVITNGKTRICEGDTTVLKVSNSGRIGNVQYKWYLNGNLVAENVDSIFIIAPGNYKVEIHDTLGCFSTSETIAIDVLRYPDLVLYVNGRTITKDTNFVLCPGESIKFKLLGWFKFQFYRNNKMMEEAEKSEWEVANEGTYYFTANNEICTTQTAKVSVEYLDLKLSLNPNYINIFVDKSEPYRDTTILLMNIGKDTIFISNISFDENAFELVSPMPPFSLPPNSQIDLIVRFKPQKSGKFFTKMFISKNCDQIDTLTLEGIKAKSVLIFNKNLIDFNIIPDCYTFSVDSSLELINVSDEEVFLNRAELIGSIELVEPAFPLKLKPGEKVYLKIKIINRGGGDNSGQIKVIFTYTSLSDTLQIQVRGKFSKVSYEVLNDFSKQVLFDECEVSKKLSINFINTSEMGLKVTLISQGQDLKILDNDNLIHSSDSARFMFEIFPTKLGVNSTKLFILIEPCHIIDSIEINYFKKGIIVKFDKDTINFGSVHTCTEPNTIFKSLIANIIGDSLGLTKIKTLEISNPFKIEFPTDSIIRNGTEISLGFKPNKGGTYESRLLILLEPCEKEYVFVLRGEFVQGSFKLDKEIIDFGSVEIGNKVEKLLTFLNTGDTLISLESSKITDNINFALDPYGVIQKYIQPSSAQEFAIYFQPQNEGYFETLIEIELSFPCDTTLILVAKGFGVAPKPRKMVVRIDNHKYMPWTIAKVPVIFKFDDTGFVSIDSLTFNLKYYPRVFDVNTVYSGSFPIRADISRYDGVINILVNTKDNSLQEGVLCYLQGMVLIGDTKISPLNLENFKIYTNTEPIVELQNGSITIDSVCAADLRLISVERLPEFYVSLQNKYLHLIVDSYSEIGNVEIFVYNLLGQSIFNENLIIPSKGVYNFVFSGQFSEGQSYLCIVRFGNTLKTMNINCCNDE